MKAGVARIREVMLPVVKPMVLVQSRTAFEHPEFIFEVKWDGFRALAHRARRTVQVRLRALSFARLVSTAFSRASRRTGVRNAG
jgi:ATP-dependent DNA ligase